jgi:hypothetical protein
MVILGGKGAVSKKPLPNKTATVAAVAVAEA